MDNNKPQSTEAKQYFGNEIPVREPAFPLAWPAEPTNLNYGMSLRDYFAGQAVGGLLAQRLPAHQGEDGAETVAQDAYIVAEAMMRERAK